MTMKLSLRTKLLAAFGTMLVLTAIVGSMGISQAARINERAAHLYADDLVGMRAAAILAQDTLLLRAKVLAHIQATNPARKAALAADIAGLDRGIDVAQAAIRAGHANGGQHQLLLRFDNAWDNYLALMTGSGKGTQRASGYQDSEEGKRLAAVTAAVQALIQSYAVEA